jgi:hypothetical protein
MLSNGIVQRSFPSPASATVRGFVNGKFSKSNDINCRLTKDSKHGRRYSE